MNIVIPDYAKNYDLLPFKTNEEASKHGLKFGNGKKNESDDYVIYWGQKPYIPDYGGKYGIMETGFFNNASFIDTVGNYQSLSLNTSMGFYAVANFDLDGRKSASDIIFNLLPHQRSKYNPNYTETFVEDWLGPVLILQNPTDRSIYSATSKKKYFDFVKGACKFYGKNLFVKFHPWNSGEKYKELEDIVKPFGCQYGKTKIDIINNAEFCLAYNSTFAVDSLIRNVPYVQFGMGTFFNAYGVIYTEGEYPSGVRAPLDMQALPNFLIHKFCFNKGMKPEKMARMIKMYSQSNEMFPMTDEFSYANNLPQ